MNIISAGTSRAMIKTYDNKKSGKSTTNRTTNIPSNIVDKANIKHKDVLVWSLNEDGSITININKGVV